MTNAGGAPGGGSFGSGSGFSKIGAGGNHVVFWSEHQNFLTSGNPADGLPHVYLRDLVAGATTLMDRSSSGAVADAGAVEGAAVSANGAAVAFSSPATNLTVPADAGAEPDVFVRNGSTTTRISQPAVGDANGMSWRPSISDGGTKVAFQSLATNLIGSDADAGSDVYVWTDNPTPTPDSLALASVSSGGVHANGPSGSPEISGDGSVVAFISDATNLVAGDTANSDVFVRNLAAGTTVKASVKSDGSSVASDDSGLSTVGVSYDGRYVVFDSEADLGGGPCPPNERAIYMRDLGAETTTLVSRDAGGNLLCGAGYPAIFARSPSAPGNPLITYVTTNPFALPAGLDAGATPDVILAELYGSPFEVRNSLVTLGSGTSEIRSLGNASVVRTPTSVKSLIDTSYALNETDDSRSDAYVAIVSAPAAPTITFPTPNQIFGTSSIAITGNVVAADAGSRIEVREGINVLGGDPLAPSETGFSVNLSRPNGETTVSVVAIKGGVEGPPASVTFTVDTVKPVPAIAFPAVGGRYASTQWNAGCGPVGFCGTVTDPPPGTAITSVEYSVRQGTGNYWNGSEFSAPGEAFHLASGGATWSVQFGFGNLPADGNYTLRVRATDSASNTTTDLASSTFVRDTTGPAITLSSPGNPTGDPTPLLSGTAGIAPGDLAGVAVKIHDGLTTMGVVVQEPMTNSLANGAYSVAPTTSLPDGFYTAQAHQVDAASNPGASAPVTFEVKTVLPDVTITNPIHGSTIGILAPTVAGTASETSPVTLNVYEGTTTAGAPVQTKMDNTLDPGWSVNLDPLTDVSTYTVVALQSNINGIGSSSPVTFKVNTAVPIVTVAAPIHESWIDTGAPTVQGTASEPSAVEVKIYQGSTASGTPIRQGTATLTQPNWTFLVPSPALGEGTYVAVASQTTASTGSGSAVFHVDLTDPVPVIDFPVTSSTLNLTTYNSGCTASVGDMCGTAMDSPSGLTDIEYSLRRSGDGKYWNGAGFASVPAIRLDATASLPSAPGVVGWNVAIDESVLEDDAYTLTVYAKDRSGWESSAVSTFNIDFDLTTPQINSPVADALLNSLSVAIGGTAQPGSSVVVREGPTQRCPATGAVTAAPTTGAWSCTGTFTEGEHTITATATLGVNVQNSLPRLFTIDVTLPATPVIADPPTGSRLNASSALVRGTLVTAGEVSVAVLLELAPNGGAFTQVAQLTPDGPGAWQTTLGGLADGTYQVRARARDAATNLGGTPPRWRSRWTRLSPESRRSRRRRSARSCRIVRSGSAGSPTSLGPPSWSTKAPWSEGAPSWVAVAFGMSSRPSPTESTRCSPGRGT